MASTVIKNLATNYIIDKTTKDNNNNGIEDIIDKATRNIISMASEAGLGGSVGCAVRLETRSRVQPPPRSATFFRGD